jgi:hypothetical protein
LLQTANKFKKSFWSETKQIKHIVTQNVKGKYEGERMHGQFPLSLDENWCIRNTPTDDWNLETLREKQKVQLWQLRIRQSAQTILREKFWKKKFKVDASYVKNMKKLLTTFHRDVPFWLWMNL